MNQENYNLNKKRQSSDVNTEINLLLGLSDKGFKAPVIKMLPQSGIRFLGMNLKIANISKEREVILKVPIVNYRTEKLNNRN